MNISSWKFELYDVLGIILPGLIVIGEGWVLVRGWDSFAHAFGVLSASGLALIILISFGAGTIIQELSDFSMKAVMGDRLFRHGRDQFWSTTEADPIKASIQAQLEIEECSADTAFDYCLTKLGGRFPKRDVFVATSDLSRSLATLALLAIVPATRVAFRSFGLEGRFVLWTLVSIVASLILFFLSWRRMVRFRELSDVTVFRAYLATIRQPALDLELPR